MPKDINKVCPVTELLDTLSKRHMLHIIYLLNESPLGFSDIEKETGINTATLTNRLNELELEKIISKKRCEIDARHFYYSLTKRGKKISDTLNKLGNL